MSLLEHQRRVAAALHVDADVGDPAIEVIRGAVRRWAVLQLVELCPLTTRMLALVDRLDGEVIRQLAAADRPPSVHRWSHDMLVRLVGDTDHTVADVARLELACVAPDRCVDTDPGPWRLERQPEVLVAALLDGEDPRRRPRSPCWIDLRRHGESWHLVRDDARRLVGHASTTGT